MVCSTDDRASRLASFEAALHLGFDEFTFRMRLQVRHMELADTVRVEVAILYRTRGWQTVDVDLGPPGAETVDLVNPAITGLIEMGLPPWREYSQNGPPIHCRKHLKFLPHGILNWRPLHTLWDFLLKMSAGLVKDFRKFLPLSESNRSWSPILCPRLLNC